MSASDFISKFLLIHSNLHKPDREPPCWNLSITVFSESETVLNINKIDFMICFYKSLLQGTEQKYCSNTC